MNQVNDQEIRRYFRQIKRLLPVSAAEKKQFIRTLQSEVETFVKENPDSSFDHIVSRFHSPEQIACDYVSALDHDSLCALLTLRSNVKRTLALLLILAVLSWSGYLCLIHILDYQSDHQPIIRTWRVEPSPEDSHE